MASSSRVPTQLAPVPRSLARLRATIGAGALLVGLVAIPAHVPGEELAERAEETRAAETSARPAPTRPPAGWQEADVRRENRRYTVVVGSYPSTALAESLREGMRNLGWSPVRIDARAGEARVILGALPSAAEARFIAEELRAGEIADAHVAAFPLTADPGHAGVDGTFLAPFTPTPAVGRPAFDPERARVRLAALADRATTMDSESFRERLDLLFTAGEEERKGAAAAALALELAAQREEPDAALWLAGRVARGEWPVAAERRIECGELVADLLYGYRRDWRGAWSATEALLDDSARTPSGRARDKLRRAALLVDLAAGPGEHRPSWNEVRAAARDAWHAAPAEDGRTKARAELIYLQTFAWEGDWARVPELADDFVRRHPDARAETAQARIQHARALERTRQYREAIAQLDRVIQMELPEASRLRMGFETHDPRGIAREERRRFNDLLAASGEGD